MLLKNNIQFNKYKDQVIFEDKEILTQNSTPYTVFTPYKNNHLKKIFNEGITQFDCESYKDNFAKFNFRPLLTLKNIGFKKTNLSAINLQAGTKGGLILIEDFKSH